MSDAPISPPHSSAPPPSAQSGLQCPYCGCLTDLTWRRYYANLTSRYRCSACGEKSKLKLNFAFVLVTIAVGMLLPIPMALLIASGFPNFSDFSFMLWLRKASDSSDLAFALWALGMMTLILWLGPYFERKHGVLHKTK